MKVRILLPGPGRGGDRGGGGRGGGGRGGGGGGGCRGGDSGPLRGPPPEGPQEVAAAPRRSISSQRGDLPPYAPQRELLPGFVPPRADSLLRYVPPRGESRLRSPTNRKSYFSVSRAGPFV